MLALPRRNAARRVVPPQDVELHGLGGPAGLRNLSLAPDWLAGRACRRRCTTSAPASSLYGAMAEGAARRDGASGLLGARAPAQGSASADAPVRPSFARPTGRPIDRSIDRSTAGTARGWEAAVSTVVNTLHKEDFAKCCGSRACCSRPSPLRRFASTSGPSTIRTRSSCCTATPATSARTTDRATRSSSRARRRASSARRSAASRRLTRSRSAPRRCATRPSTSRRSMGSSACRASASTCEGSTGLALRLSSPCQCLCASVAARIPQKRTPHTHAH